MRHLLLMLIIVFSRCESVKFNCPHSRTYSSLDSLLAKRDNENIYFDDPGYRKELTKKMCQKVGDFHIITYVETKSLFNEERNGVIYLNDNGKFFSAYQKNHTSEVKLTEDVVKNNPHYKLILLLKNDFKSKADSLKNVYSNRKIMDAPFLRAIYLDNSIEGSTSSSFIIPYIAEDFR